jgi:hypothetical protein
VDAAGRPLGREGAPSPGLYYLGPWLRARDFEATAVQELRVQAAELAQRLAAAPARPVTIGRLHRPPGPDIVAMAARP